MSEVEKALVKLAFTVVIVGAVLIHFSMVWKAKYQTKCLNAGGNMGWHGCEMHNEEDDQ